MTKKELPSPSKRLRIYQIPAIVSSQNRCCICKNKKGRNLIHLHARVDIWVKLGIYIPSKNRTCREHLKNQMFKIDVFANIINNAKYDRVMNSEEINNCLQFFKTLVDFKKNPLNFDSMVGWTDGDVYSLFGVSMKDFEELLTNVKPYLKKSKRRSVRNCLAIFLMKMRLNVSQNVLAILFGLRSQSSVSRIIKSVMEAFEKSSFVDSHVGFGHTSRQELIESHARKFFNSVLNVSEDNLVVILDATYLYIEKPSDHKLQRDTFSMHKHRNLVKTMFVVCPDGYLLAADGLYLANGKNNDANILEAMLLQSGGITDIVQENDAFIGRLNII